MVLRSVLATLAAGRKISTLHIDCSQGVTTGRFGATGEGPSSILTNGVDTMTNFGTAISDHDVPGSGLTHPPDVPPPGDQA